MLVSKNGKICGTANVNAKSQTPNASQWNVVCVGSPGVGSHAGHVHFVFFVSISFALAMGSRFSVEYGLKH